MEQPTSDAGEQAGEVHDAFLSGPPRSGELSTFAQKLLGECFVWLASMVVFGSTVNLVANNGQCAGLCKYAIATGIISVLITSLLLLGHYLTWTTKMDRSSWFTSVAEMRFMAVLVVWWGAGVGGLSAVTRSPTQTSLKMFAPVSHASGVGIFFGWLAFFGSIYTTFKAYHASKEEQRALIMRRAFRTPRRLKKRSISPTFDHFFFYRFFASWLLKGRRHLKLRH